MQKLAELAARKIGIWENAAGWKPFGLLGILNLTPDSFYDGGQFNSETKAVEQARKLLDAGAAILDMGAESTRPGATPLPPDDELARLLPAFSDITQHFPRALISIDTWHAKTARCLLQRGASIINDVSGCLWDDAMRGVLAEFRPGYVLTHSAGHRPDFPGPASPGGIMDELERFFDQALNRLAQEGLPEENIVLDPGIGFGKNLRQNLEILANIGKLLQFGRPLLIGLSMKKWLGELLGTELCQRACPTAVASALLWNKGVFWHRVHQPWLVRPALELAAALANSGL